MDAARAESVIRAVEGWRAAVARGAAAWDALSAALAALEEEEEEEGQAPAAAGAGDDNDATMRVYEELMQEAPSAGLHAFIERERRRRRPAAGSRARRRQQGAEGDSDPSTAVATAALCAFLLQNGSGDGSANGGGGGASAAEALQSSLARLRVALEDAEDASAVLGAEARALESLALAADDEGRSGIEEEEEDKEEAAADKKRDAPVFALEAALLASSAAQALARELRWMRRAARGAGPDTPAASAKAAAAMWRLQPFTDDDALDALVGGCASLV